MQTGAPSRSGRWAERDSLSPATLALLAVLAAPGPAPDAAAAGAPALPALRRGFAATATALARGDAAPAVAPSLDGTPLGLPGLAPWISLAAGFPGKKTSVAALLAYASAQDEVFAREALGDAARLAATPAEKRDVRGALAARPAPDPRQARAGIARALAVARVAAFRDEAGRTLAAMGGAWPDAPERAADLFDETDRTEFDAAMKTAPPDARAARARAVAGRDPKQAAALLRSLGPVPPASVRATAAEAWLLAGGPKDARRLLALPAPDGLGDADVLHRAALTWIAEARSLAPAPQRASRTGKNRRGKKPASPKAPPALSPAQRAEAELRLADLASLLARPLVEEDRRRVLESAVRLARRAGRSDDARALLPRLLEIDPGNDAGAAEAFRDAFDLYAVGRFAGGRTLLRGTERDVARGRREAARDVLGRPVEGAPRRRGRCARPLREPRPRRRPGPLRALGGRGARHGGRRERSRPVRRRRVRERHPSRSVARAHARAGSPASPATPPSSRARSTPSSPRASRPEPATTAAPRRS